MEEASGSTPLFAVFLISLLSLFLFPYTLYILFGGGEDETKVRLISLIATYVGGFFACR
jgi:translocation protein SEC63